MEIAEQIGFVDWVDVDVAKVSGVFKAVPERDQLPPDIQEALVVALYSK
jgi:small subunit ribosomal protein S4